jgi:galacturan 1,4-alpha-galacturonidase
LTISDITIKNMYGTTSGKEDPEAGTLVCSAPDVSKIMLRLGEKQC